MGQQENAQVLRNLHSTFTSGDMEQVMALFSDDATWHVAGNNATAGDFRGKDEVRRSMEIVGELSGGTFNPEMHDIAASDEHAVFIGRLKAQRSGRTMDEPVAVVFHVSDGKISEVWEMAYNQKAVDDFWS
jgi:ketosteroid isomerase-like protein